MRRIATVLVLLGWIPFCRQPLWGQASSVGKGRIREAKQLAQKSTDTIKSDQRGTKDSPLVIDAEGHKKTPEETAKDKADEDRRSSVERWTLAFAGASAVATVILMIVGIAGVRAANRTLRAIEDGTKATRDNVNAFINSERAWLSTDSLAEFKLDPPPLHSFGLTVMSMSIHNVGKSTCRIKEVRVSFHTVKQRDDLAAVPVYGGSDSREYILAPGGKPLNVGSTLTEGHLSEELIKELRAQKRFLYFYFVVTYVDGHRIDGKEIERIFRECYEYYCPLGLVLLGIDVEGWKESGPKSYTEYT